MSVNDIPRNSFNDMEKEGPPPEYSPSCSNNGGHPNDVYGDGVVTADIVQEHSLYYLYLIIKNNEKVGKINNTIIFGIFNNLIK